MEPDDDTIIRLFERVVEVPVPPLFTGKTPKVSVARLIPAHVKSPFAAIDVANVFEAQSMGLAERA